MKISTNSALAKNKPGWIDFNAGVILENEPMEKTCERFIGINREITLDTMFPANSDDLAQILRREIIRRARTHIQSFDAFLRFGGLPGLHELQASPRATSQYLSDVFNSVLLNGFRLPARHVKGNTL